MLNNKIDHKSSYIRKENKRNLVSRIKLLMVFLVWLSLIPMGYFYFYNRDLHKSCAPASVMPGTAHASGFSFSSLNIRTVSKSALLRNFLYLDANVQDEKYLKIKNAVNAFITDQKEKGTIHDASVIVKELLTESWFGINESQSFSPGSLMKVPVLISLLKDAERSPALLDAKVYYGRHQAALPFQVFPSERLESNRYYTIKELLHAAIACSDNDAALLLNRRMNEVTFRQVFADFNLAVPQAGQKDFPISAREYSRFFMALCHATYLNEEMSEYAMQLLSECNFREGITRELDAGVVTARKFGEKRTVDSQYNELHEFGIIYLDRKPYLIGAMTRGNDFSALASFISAISKMVFDEMKNMNAS